tara:strand:+ start:500 stop:739 length:240 start_codon:yes stop_codon:yes gene_type:complete
MTTKDNKDVKQLFKGWAFGKKNYLIFSIGLALVILGYIFMANGEVNSFQSLTLAPIMLFLGYIVVIPVSLVYRDKSKKI